MLTIWNNKLKLEVMYVRKNKTKSFEKKNDTVVQIDRMPSFTVEIFHGIA